MESDHDHCRREIDKLRAKTACLDMALSTAQDLADRYREEVQKLEAQLEEEQEITPEVGGDAASLRAELERTKADAADDVLIMTSAVELASRLKSELEAVKHAGRVVGASLEVAVARLDEARAALLWAMGGPGSDFRGRKEGEGGYWWRKELSQRAGMTWSGAEYVWGPVSTPVKPETAQEHFSRCGPLCDHVEICEECSQVYGVCGEHLSDPSAAFSFATHPLEDLKEKQP